MIEWLVTSLFLLALAVVLSRRGHRHLVVPGFPWAVMGVCAFAAWLLESLPFTSFPATPGLLTAVSVAVGLMIGRLAGRAMTAWAHGHERDAAAGLVPADSRIVHPLIGTGLVVLGSPLLFTLAALRHESLEIQQTPRDPQTSVVLGGEDRRIPGDPFVSHGVLLLHGFLGSPADLGDLADALHQRGLTVRSLRLPGHATGPSVLDDVLPHEYDDAVATARKELAGTTGRVSIVGMSFGGALAIRSAAANPPSRLVLVNPWLGRTWTPPWSPAETDTLMGLAARTIPRVMKPPAMTRVDDPDGRARVRTYATVRTRAAAAARELAASAAAPEVAARLTAPTLVLLSTHDQTARSDFTASWFASLPLPEPAKRLVRYERSNHILLQDYDRAAAIDEIVRFLTIER